jgi:hypothetical protein
MLLSFRFANYRSFQAEQQLNLLPVYDSDYPGSDQLVEPVPVVAIFGPNASGKSNLIDAFTYMCNFVGRSDREVEPGLELSRLAIKRRSFKLDPVVAGEPSSFVVDLLLQGVRYTYGFILNDSAVLEEWLYSYPKRRRRVVFQRHSDDFVFGEESGQSSITEITGIVAPTALLLSVVARFGRFDSREASEGFDETYKLMHSVYSWLYLGLARPSATRSAPFAPLAKRWIRDPRRRMIITDLLRAADVGLRDVELRQPDQVSELELSFSHYGAAENVWLDIEDESSGTIRLLELAARAVAAIDEGGIFLVDEIDASLHPLLTAKIIGLFQSKAVNRNGSQLIFTSHDPTLLGMLDGQEVLRRDEIWFVEKASDGSSHLYPLTEFKPRRQGENRVRRYLNGSYGAIPELSMELFRSALVSREQGYVAE